jgi:hypothetical protein
MNLIEHFWREFFLPCIVKNTISFTFLQVFFDIFVRVVQQAHTLQFLGFGLIWNCHLRLLANPKNGLIENPNSLITRTLAVTLPKKSKNFWILSPIIGIFGKNKNHNEIHFNIIRETILKTSLMNKFLQENIVQ